MSQVHQNEPVHRLLEKTGTLHPL